ncbi:nuclear transport factor 2 family protein [Geodermatophilus sp. SYSU D01045]
MARTPHEVFQAHGAALDAGDVDAVAADYAEDALLITPDGVVRGRDGIRSAFAGMLSEIPGATWEFPTQHFVDDVLFLEWRAVSEKARAEGVDTFVFDGGAIRVQTIRFTLERTG